MKTAKLTDGSACIGALFLIPKPAFSLKQGIFRHYSIFLEKEWLIPLHLAHFFR